MSIGKLFTHCANSPKDEWQMQIEILKAAIQTNEETFSLFYCNVLKRVLHFGHEAQDRCI